MLYFPSYRFFLEAILIKRHIINERIRAQEVRLIGAQGDQLGVVPTVSALAQAKDLDLDLVMVSETSSPPVCRLIDYGQYKYQQQKKDKSNKKSRGQVTKEVKMSPKISSHDYDVRVNRATDFLKKGHKVKLFVPFRGREIVHPELGTAIIKKFLDEIKEIGVPESGISRAPRAMTVMINPK